MPGLNIATILSYVLAVAVGVLIYFVYAKLNISKANVSAQKIIDDATSKADNLVKEAILDAKTQAYELKLEAEKEIKEQKQEITELENNLSEREKGIERRDIAVQGKEDVLEQRIKQLDINNHENTTPSTPALFYRSFDILPERKRNSSNGFC